MIRNATPDKMLLSWGFRIAILGTAALIAIAPVDGRGAPKASVKKGTGARSSSVKEATTAGTEEGEKVAGEKPETAAPAEGAIKLPEQVYSTGYNGS
jgi:hypothetical protein